MKLPTFLTETLELGFYVFLFIVAIAALLYAVVIISDLFDHTKNK